MLNKAVEWGHLDKNPAEGVKQLRIRKDERPRFLTREEIERLLQSCTEGLYPFVYAALNTGLRSSELVYLRWKDVDLKSIGTREANMYSAPGMATH